MNIAKDFAQYLETLGFGLLGADIFYGDMPASPDKCIVVYEFEGVENEDMGSYNPGMQVCVRSSPNDYDEARTLMQGIEDELNKIGNEFYKSLASGISFNDTTYLRVYSTLGVTPSERDANNRIQFIQKYLIIK